MLQECVDESLIDQNMNIKTMFNLENMQYFCRISFLNVKQQGTVLQLNFIYQTNIFQTYKRYQLSLVFKYKKELMLTMSIILKNYHFVLHATLFSKASEFIL